MSTTISGANLFLCTKMTASLTNLNVPGHLITSTLLDELFYGSVSVFDVFLNVALFLLINIP